MRAAVTVDRLWPGEPFLVCGAGPSLSAADLALWRQSSPRPRLIVVNNAVQLAPDADVLYAADAQWWTWNIAVADTALPALLFGAQPSISRVRSTVRVIATRNGNGISTDPSWIYSGGHGGHQAINVAALLGAASIALLGFDMGADRAGRHHFHPAHPNGTHPTYRARLPAFRGLRAALDALHIPIVNCSRQTAIPADVIPRQPLEVALSASWLLTSKPA